MESDSAFCLQRRHHGLPAARSPSRAQPALRIRIGRRRADIEDVGAVLQAARGACASAASGARYLPPSEKESSVMLRMPRIFMAGSATRNRKGRPKPPYLDIDLPELNDRGCGSGEMIGPGRAGARLAGRRHRRAFAARRQHRILIRRAHRRDALEQRDDLVARQGLIFQQAPRQHIADRLMRSVRMSLARLIASHR